MTLETTTRVKVHTGNGVTTVFPYDFFIPTVDDLEVYLYDITDMTLTLLSSALYSVTGLGTDTFGSVTYPLSGSPISSDEQLRIVRTVPLTQETDLSNQGAFYLQALEDRLDRLTMMVQQLQEQQDRMPKATVGEIFVNDLPAKSALANKYLTFDANGEPQASSVVSVGSLVLPVSIANGGTGAASAGAARTALGLGSGDTPAFTSFTVSDKAAAKQALDLGTDDIPNFAGIRKTGVITPTALSANVNDYNPTGLSAAGIIRLGSDIARSITGLTAQADGTEIQLININTSFILTFTFEDASSSAANRFLFDASIAVYPNSALTVRYDGTSSRWRMVNKASQERPQGYLYGMILTNNAGDTTNDIDISAGTARAANTTNINLSAITKRLDAAWAVGTNQGGLDTGSIGNGTYHVHAIKRMDTLVTDVLFSLSVGAPTLPTGYTVSRRIGAFVRAAGAIVPFIHDDNRFTLKVPVRDSAANPGTAAVTRTLASIPTGIRVEAILEHAIRDLTTDFETYGLLSDLSITDSVPSVSLRDAMTFDPGGSANTIGRAPRNIMTNTSAQIRSRLSASNADITEDIITYGWIDNRDIFH